MLQRGRKPTQNTVALVQSYEALEPPTLLTREERKVWRDVVNSKPPDWFDKDSAYLLVNFCHHVVTARHLSQRIENLDPTDVPMLDKLLRMRANETKSLLSLANAMRISQHAQTRAETAAVAAGQTRSDKPWAS